MTNNDNQTDLFEDLKFENPTSNTDALRPLKTPRLLKAARNQVEFRIGSIDEIIPSNHKARLVWAFVERLDLSKYLINIKSIENHAGRPAIDPKIIVAVWLYGTIEGIASARTLGRYCEEHYGFIWIRGDVKIGRKTLSNFRAEQGELLDDLLAQSIAIMLDKNLISLDEIGQDGMRVRAHAGSSSFNRMKTLKGKYKAAKKYLKEILKESGTIEDKIKQREIKLAINQKEKIEDAIREIEKIKNEKKKLENVKESRH